MKKNNDKKKMKKNNDEQIWQIENKGFKFYTQGKYKKASQLLKKSIIENNDYTFADIYADICFRNLDKGNHSTLEAAYWYLKAAQFGDGDVLAYLRSLSKSLIEDLPQLGDVDDDDDMNKRIQKLTSIWENNFIQ